jgi:hypothetical protein
MEILKRKIECKKETINSTKEKAIKMSVAIIDGMRLSCRWHVDGENDKDTLINFTETETEKIRRAIGRRDC